ncbi:MAG: hypothetical protein H7Z43_12465 [Clostridia bacterium]|nr:hypothetical protein [Deltaproteobacteria bacterium]
MSLETRPLHICALLVFVAAVLRVPYFFHDVIEWDESTFILMGQSLRDGHLPYVELWDNKPPLCFVPFAITVALFGKSIPAIRALGLSCVSAVGVLTYAVGIRLGGRRIGVIAGILCVVLLSYAPGGMATMSEPIALVPLMGALLFALVERPTVATIVGLSACLAAATLVRTNLAVVSAVLALLVLREARTSGFGALRAAAAFSGGTAVPWVICALPYALTGTLSVFAASVFLAPAWYALHGVARRLGWAAVAPYPLERVSQKTTYLVAFAGGTILSVVLSGFGAAHYWLQVHPFVAIALAAALDCLLGARLDGLTRNVRYGVSAAMLVLMLTGFSAYALMHEVLPHQLTTHGTAVNVARHLEAHNPERRPVLLFSDHLAYWFLGMQPLAKVMTHPTNLFRPSALHAAMGPGATSLDATREIFAQKPLYIVRRERLRFAENQPEAKALIEATIADDYTLETKLGKTLVYRRSSL